jgi:hypothetical protein
MHPRRRFPKKRAGRSGEDSSYEWLESLKGELLAIGIDRILVEPVHESHRLIEMEMPRQPSRSSFVAARIGMGPAAGLLQGEQQGDAVLPCSGRRK